MPCYPSGRMNFLADDLTKTPFLYNVSLGSVSLITIPFSEFDGESSTNDALSDTLKSMLVEKIFPRDTTNAALFARIQFQPPSPHVSCANVPSYIKPPQTLVMEVLMCWVALAYVQTLLISF